METEPHARRLGHLQPMTEKPVSGDVGRAPDPETRSQGRGARVEACHPVDGAGDVPPLGAGGAWGGRRAVPPPASRAFSAPPRKISRMISPGRSSGIAATFNAIKGVAPMA